MSDQNTTHSPRVDDQLAHDGEPEEVDDVGGAPGDAELDARTRLAASLVPSAFPGTGHALADVAAEQDGAGDVVAMLRALPEGRIYATVAEVWDDLGGETEHRS